MPLDQKAVVQELYSRIGTLPPEKAAIVSELAGRFGLTQQQGPPDPAMQMRNKALADTNEHMALDDEGTPQSAGDAFKAQLQGINPVALAKAYVDHMNHPYETASGLPGGGMEDIPGAQAGVTAGVQASNGNLRGAFGTATGAATDAAILGGAMKIAGKVAAKPGEAPVPETPAQNSSILDKIKTIASHPDSPGIVKDALKLAGGYRLAKAWDIAEQVLSRQKEAPTPTPTSPGKASTNMPVGTQTNGTVSVGAASSAMGTETPRSNYGFAGTTAPGNPFFQAAQTLDHATQVRLAKAAQNGQMQALPVETRGQLVQAVQNGDMNAIHNIMDAVEKSRPVKEGDITPQGTRVDQATLNKAAILIKYARDTNMPDFSGVTNPASRQQIANGAIAHAIREGHWEQYSNKTASYRGISDDSMKIIGDALNFLDGKH